LGLAVTLEQALGNGSPNSCQEEMLIDFRDVFLYKEIKEFEDSEGQLFIRGV
jgi:hypothetical protein